jgi:starch synthase
MREVPRVVLAAAEAVPLAKAGGLGDVTSALASALTAAGCEVTLLLPAYGFIDRSQLRVRPLHGFRTFVRIAERDEPVQLLEGVLPGTAVRLLLIDHEGFFARDGIYEDPVRGEEFTDAVERWVFLSRAVLAALPALGLAPDVLHLNDYHVALSAAYRSVEARAGHRFLARTGIVLGLHNLGYQGCYPAERFDVTGLPGEFMASMGALEFWGQMNFLKAGLVHADLLTTVSPTYAREIQESAECGYGLQDLLRQRSDDLVGILNGIDTNRWDPASDALIPARYDSTSLAGKAECKRTLQRRSGLVPDAHVPLFGMISRLVTQKGVDLLLETLPRMLRMPLQVVLLGRGQREYERRLATIAREHPGRISIQLVFDDALAHWIEAGSDFFLMPSRYEPCGLNQMYSMRYGTVPLVRRTGGLADTVRDWDPKSRQGTGFVFDAYSADAFLATIRRACAIYKNPELFALLRQSGMQEDFSWARSARSYLALYERARARRTPLVAARAPGNAHPGLGPDGGIDSGSRIGNIRADFERE